MTLPTKIFFSILLSVFIFSVSFVSVSANHQKSYQPPSSYTPTPVATSSVAGAVQGQVLGLGCAAWNPLSWGSCIEDAAAKIIDFGVGIVQKVFIRQSTGCDLEDTSCQETALREIQNGVPVAQMEHKGALIIAASFLDSAKTMPVPIDSKTYFASINPFKSAQADSGADDLATSGGGKLLKFWQIMRNASYALMVVVLIVIGFMIMLRIPINPRTVVTAQNALPKVAVSLLLITFSFAISGLMIDIGRIAIQMVGWLASQVGIEFLSLFLKLVGIIIFSIVFNFAFGPGVLLIMVLLVLFVLFIFLMIAWKMITRMAMFIILTIFSPLVFLMGAIPMGEGMVVGWFKRQLSNILAIPAMILMIVVALVLADITNFPTPLEEKVNPFGLASLLLGPMIALGVLMAATRVPEMIDDALKLREPGKGAGMTGGAIIGAGMTASRLGGPVIRTASNLLGRSAIAKKMGASGWLERRALQKELAEARTPGAEARVDIKAGRLDEAQEKIKKIGGGTGTKNYTGVIQEQEPGPGPKNRPPPPQTPKVPYRGYGVQSDRGQDRGQESENAQAQAEADRRIKERGE